MPAIENGDGEKVDDRQIGAQHREEEEERTEALLGRSAGLLENRHRPPQEAGADLPAPELLQEPIDHRKILECRRQPTRERRADRIRPLHLEDLFEDQPAIDEKRSRHDRRLEDHVAPATGVLDRHLDPRPGGELLHHGDHAGPVRLGFRQGHPGSDAAVGLPRLDDPDPRHVVSGDDPFPACGTIGEDLGHHRDHREGDSDRRHRQRCRADRRGIDPGHLARRDREGLIDPGPLDDHRHRRPDARPEPVVEGDRITDRRPVDRHEPIPLHQPRLGGWRAVLHRLDRGSGHRHAERHPRLGGKLNVARLLVDRLPLPRDRERHGPIAVAREVGNQLRVRIEGGPVDGDDGVSAGQRRGGFAGAPWKLAWERVE